MKKDEELLVSSTPAIRLKDHPAERSIFPIHLRKEFGFVPEIIILEKVRGKSSFVVKAVLTEEEIAVVKKARKKGANT